MVKGILRIYCWFKCSILDLVGPMHKENVNYCGCTEFNCGQRNSKSRIEVTCYRRASSTDGSWDMALWVCCQGIQLGRTRRNNSAHTIWAVNDWLEVHWWNTTNVRRGMTCGIWEIQAVTWIQEVRMQLLPFYFYIALLLSAIVDVHWWN